LHNASGAGRGQAIVHDIKGENWGLTAGWRSRFGRVLFDPTNTKSTAYNPLLEVRLGKATCAYLSHWFPLGYGLLAHPT
jgi:type IV secretory pathway TraG/TraD family ATPase VirD4